MAKLTQETRELILADFHTGRYSQRSLAKKYSVSVGTVNKITKGLSPKHKEKVNAQISIITELSEENEQEVNAVHKAVEEATKNLIFFQNSALKNQKLANELLEDAATISEVESHSRITAKNKETVIGKEPVVNIQNNNVQNNLEHTGIEIKFSED